MSDKKGVLVVFSAPSGCGKDTILTELFKRNQNNEMTLSISMTTRNPRIGEKDGVDYFFASRERFEQLIKDDELIEFAEYNGNYYGTPKAPVEKWLNEGKIVFLEIEVQGAGKVMQKFPEAKSIFILPPSIEELERRLRNRNTDSSEVIEKRIALAPDEIAHSKDFDYCVVNDDIQRATDEVYTIIQNLKGDN